MRAISGPEAEASAKALVAARAERRALAEFPGVAPRSLADAYRIQDAAIRLWPCEIAGWKLGAAVAPADADGRSARVTGPVFADRIWYADHGPANVLLIPDGYAAVEVELLVQIASDIDFVAIRPPIDLRDHIAGVRAGIEIVGSPFPGLSTLGPIGAAADFGMNLGLVVGPELQNWEEALAAIPCSAHIDGKRAGDGSTGNLPGGLLAALGILIANLAARGRTVKSGDLISTGALTGVHPVAVGQTVEARFGGGIRIGCRCS